MGKGSAESIKKAKTAPLTRTKVIPIRYTRVFGYVFQKLNDDHLEDLFSLEREHAIYTDHWIDELGDFRKVRIAFTPGEVREYVRSLWAYEFFLRAGSPVLAATVEGIPKDIAKRSDQYQLTLKGGRTLGPPWHCPASFFGRDIERLVCTNERAEVLQETGRAGFILTIKRIIDSLTPAIRRFQEREKGLTQWPITCEDDVRDLLYVMLRGAICDIKTEEPVPSRAGTHKFVDIVSSLAHVFIEVKWIDKRGQWKRILRELNDDIQSYYAHPDCDTLIFLVIDAVKDIPDPSQFERGTSCKQKIDGKKFEVLCFVREP